MPKIRSMRGFEVGCVVCLLVGAFGCQAKISPDSVLGDPLPLSAYPAISVEPQLASVLVSDGDRILWEQGSRGRAASLTVPVRSIADVRIPIQHRALWFDERGAEIGSTQWRRMVLEPQLEQQIQVNSLSSEAQSWRLEIRSTR